MGAYYIKFVTDFHPLKNPAIKPIVMLPANGVSRTDKADLIDTSKLITIDEKELGKYIEFVVEEVRKEHNIKWS